MNLMQFIVAALIVEALWETVKMFWQDGKFSVDRIGAVAFGELIALGADLDFMRGAGIALEVPFAGMILTGLLISRGANFMHDILARLSSIQNSN